MSAKVGADPDAARRINGAGSDFRVPGEPRAELAAMPPAAWAAAHGETLASERRLAAADPDWPSNPDSWWAREAGRAGAAPPIWLRREWHLPELDSPAGGDRAAAPLDARPPAERPLWAARMGLAGPPLPPQSATVFGHRAEYLPAHQAAAPSMHERYQPAYARVVGGELPDAADPPDGRFWAAGVAQGPTTNPYARRFAVAARRKPITAGPRSIAVVVDGETHTLANAVRDAAWLHPDVELAGYTIEHPVYRHVNLRVQARPGAGAGAAERALAETLELTRELFGAAGAAMEAAVAARGGAPPAAA